MKAKSASTLKAMLSIDSMQTSMADIAARALMKAEARAAAKSGVKSKSKAQSESSAASKTEDFFTMPFQQILAQSESF